MNVGTVEVKIQGGVARIFLNRPEKSNALTTEVLQELLSCVKSLEDHPQVRVAILGGHGKAFCGGADVKELGELNEGNAGAFVEKIHRVCQAIRALPVPVVARLHGAVIGAGLEIAAACDLRIAAQGTKFAMPEVKLGIPSVVEAALLPRLMGSGRAAWLVLTGEAIDAERAYEWGLVEEIHSYSELDAGLERLLTSLLSGEPNALREQKRLLQLWDEAPLAASVAQSIEAFSRALAGGNTISSRLRGKKD
jgi:enoyl-CoA hydratase/carnithine racemase